MTPETLAKIETVRRYTNALWSGNPDVEIKLYALDAGAAVKCGPWMTEADTLCEALDKLLAQLRIAAAEKRQAVRLHLTELEALS